MKLHVLGLLFLGLVAGQDNQAAGNGLDARLSAERAKIRAEKAAAAAERERKRKEREKKQSEKKNKNKKSTTTEPPTTTTTTTTSTTTTSTTSTTTTTPKPTTKRTTTRRPIITTRRTTTRRTTRRPIITTPKPTTKALNVFKLPKPVQTGQNQNQNRNLSSPQNQLSSHMQSGGKYCYKCQGEDWDSCTQDKNKILCGHDQGVCFVEMRSQQGKPKYFMQCKKQAPCMDQWRNNNECRPESRGFNYCKQCCRAMAYGASDNDCFLGIKSGQMSRKAWTAKHV